MFKRTKIKIHIEFDLETGNMKLVFKPKETRPSKVALILGNAQSLLDQSLREVENKEKEPGYIT